MLVKDLKEILNKLSDDVNIYIEADHCQLSEQAYSISFTYQKELPHYGDEIDWLSEEDLYFDKVTAINIGY